MSNTADLPTPPNPARYASLIGELSASFPKAKFEPTDDAALLASQISRLVPEAERIRWYGYLLQDAAPPAASKKFRHLLVEKLGYVVLGVTAIAVILGIITALLSPSLGFREAMAKPEIARGVITFLFAFGTISIALLIATASYWIKSEDLEARFGYAKDILMVLIGILGTIIGFYFGKTDTPQPQTETAAITSPATPETQPANP